MTTRDDEQRAKVAKELNRMARNPDKTRADLEKKLRAEELSQQELDQELALLEATVGI